MIKKLATALAALLLSASIAQAACWQWSKTAASNATADPSINFAEGMAPSAVNDSARAMMARLAECRDDISGSLLTTGTSTAYALATNQGTIASTPADGQQLAFRVHVANGVASTLAADGGTAYPIQTAPGSAVGSGVLVLGAPYRATFSTSSSSWLLQSFYNSAIPAGSIVTSMLADAAVTYPKIQNVTNNRVLGNFSGGAAAPSEYSLTGATPSGSNIAIPFAPPGSFKNLAIKVTGNTGATVTADYVTTTNGTTFQTTAVSCTLNMATSGINGIDTGAIALATWYAVWVNVKADGTTGCTASLQFTANATFLTNLPATYTHYARVGALRTATGVAQLMGTWQLGRRAQYVLGLAQTTSLPTMQTGANGNPTGGTYVAIATGAFVPSTASVISVLGNGNTNAAIAVAPNNSYGGVGNASTGPPIGLTGSASGSLTLVNGQMLLESTNIYGAMAGDANSTIRCVGWEDGI